MELSVPLEAVCRLIVRARELEAQTPSIEADDDDDVAEADDDGMDVIEDEVDESVEAEMRASLDELADEHITEVLALAWIGRGTYDASEWEEAIEEANDPSSEDPIDQLLDMPELAAYLDAGLAAFDLSCDGVGQGD